VILDLLLNGSTLVVILGLLLNGSTLVVILDLLLNGSTLVGILGLLVDTGCDIRPTVEPFFTKFFYTPSNDSVEPFNSRPNITTSVEQ
jgi:hypothetical protein